MYRRGWQSGHMLGERVVMAGDKSNGRRADGHYYAAGCRREEHRIGAGHGTREGGNSDVHRMMYCPNRESLLCCVCLLP